MFIGGGPAAFFAAITLAEALPGARVVILEKGRDVLQKVKISGGGRCNVTHACFDPKELVKHYPRGGKALLGPFHKFGAQDTVAWFRERGVRLKTEADGRMFPGTDNSETIVRCLSEAARRAGVAVHTGQNVVSIQPPGEGRALWQVTTHTGQHFQAEKTMIATGSSARIWAMLAGMGHRIVPPVPSLFTFNIKDPLIAGLQGVSVPMAGVQIKGEKLAATGPLLITHWGMSGPAILKLSAWGARILHERGYRFEVELNWIGNLPPGETAAQLSKAKLDWARKVVSGSGPFSEIPNRLWERIVLAAGIGPGQRWADLNKEKLQRLTAQLTGTTFQVHGKSTFKEEFVTAGGIHLDEVDFQRFESKIHPGLHFAGEVLDIDAVTGGFNFQAAWTGGYLAGLAMAADFGTVKY